MEIEFKVEHDKDGNVGGVKASNPYRYWCGEALTDFWNIPRYANTVWVVFTDRPVAQCYHVTSVDDPYHHLHTQFNDLYLSGYKQMYEMGVVKLVNRFIKKHGKCYVSVEVEQRK